MYATQHYVEGPVACPAPGSSTRRSFGMYKPSKSHGIHNLGSSSLPSSLFPALCYRLSQPRPSNFVDLPKQKSLEMAGYSTRGVVRSHGGARPPGWLGTLAPSGNQFSVWNSRRLDASVGAVGCPAEALYLVRVCWATYDTYCCYFLPLCHPFSGSLFRREPTVTNGKLLIFQNLYAYTMLFFAGSVADFNRIDCVQ